MLFGLFGKKPQSALYDSVDAHYVGGGNFLLRAREGKRSVLYREMASYPDLGQDTPTDPISLVHESYVGSVKNMAGQYLEIEEKGAGSGPLESSGWKKIRIFYCKDYNFLAIHITQNVGSDASESMGLLKWNGNWNKSTYGPLRPDLAAKIIKHYQAAFFDEVKRLGVPYYRDEAENRLMGKESVFDQNPAPPDLIEPLEVFQEPLKEREKAG